MAKPKYEIPKIIYARVDVNCDKVVLAETDVEKFDDEGPVGRYVLESRGMVTIDTAFVPSRKKRR